MNKFKFFVLTNLLFHTWFLFTCPIPFMANVVGVIPLIVYSLLLCLIVKETDTYYRLLFKSSLIFLAIAIILSIVSSTLMVGVVLSSLGIVLGLLIQPLLLRYCK